MNSREKQRYFLKFWIMRKIWKKEDEILEKRLEVHIFFQNKSSPPCRWTRPGYPINFDPSLTKIIKGRKRWGVGDWDFFGKSRRWRLSSVTDSNLSGKGDEYFFKKKRGRRLQHFETWAEKEFGISMIRWNFCQFCRSLVAKYLYHFCGI